MSDFVNIEVTTEETKMYDFLASHFSTQNGKKALGFIKKIWGEQVIADPSIEPSHAFFREGQRSVARLLEDNITSYNDERKNK